MKRLLTRIPLLIAMFMFACADTATAEPLPTLENTWTVEMTHSGGIAGISHSIQVSSDGAFVVSDDYANVKNEGQLSAKDLADLKQLVASTRYVEVPQQTGCADCFIYDIAIASTGKPFKAHVDDITLEDSGLGPLIMELHTIMERELN
jgi:hypothetical protein